MDLKHIKGIGPSKQDKLKTAGVADVHALARADVAKVAKATGLSESTIKEYKEKAVAATLLEDIKGIGPATVTSLAEAGIVGLKEFYKASSERIAKELGVAQEKAKHMQAQAVEMASRVAAGAKAAAEDAKTSEGRKKLAGEGKDLAVKVGEAAQKTVVDLYHRAKKDGEAAIKKAQELRQEAPAKIHEAREKAEAALKDAEGKIKDLQAKAPKVAKDVQEKAEAAVKDARAKVDDLRDKTSSFVKTEVEKVKAANEGFVGRIKQRFQKADA